MFKIIEISEQVYEAGKNSKTFIKVDANRDGHVRKRKGGGVASPNKPKKGHTEKHKTKISGHPRDAPIDSKNTYMLHVTRHSSAECKVLKIYFEKYAAQRPHQNK